MKKSLKNHYKVLFIYLAVLTILRGELPKNFEMFFSLLGLWVGGMIGMGLLILDRVIHIYIERPEEQLSREIRQLVRGRKWRDAVETLMIRKGEQDHLAFRNGVFAFVFVPVLFFAVTSAENLFGKGIALGVMLHFLYDAWRDYTNKPEHFRSWFLWMVKREVTAQEQKTALWVLTGAFGLMSLLLL